jgi:glycosyltransferase involved in cell wall biosynthesis
VQDIKKSAAFIWNTEAKRAMEQTIRDVRPDIIHLHNIYHHLSASILAPIRAARIPCVQTLHDYKLACPNYKMFTEGSPCERCKGGKYMEAVKHHCLTAGTAGNVLAAFEMGMTKAMQSYERTVRTFICPTQFMADKMIAWGEPPSKFTVVPNPADVSATPSLRDGGYVLAAGRLSQEKGLDVLIRAAAQVPDVHVRIAGIGPEEARLKSLAEELGARNVTFLGFLRGVELAEQRVHADAFAVPSVWYENAPLAVLEAMGEGLPVVASRIGGLPELVVDGENGILVEPGNVNEWARALKSIAACPKEVSDGMAAESRRRIETVFAWDAHLSRLEEIYGV